MLPASGVPPFLSLTLTVVVIHRTGSSHRSSSHFIVVSVMPPAASNKSASSTSRGRGSFASSQAKATPAARSPPAHPSSISFSGVLTLGHTRRGDGRTRVFDADFYVGADNCHAMTGVLFFYDKNNEYGQLEYDDLYFYYVWGRIARYDPAAGVNLFYVAGYEQGAIDVVGDIERLEFIGVRDPEADYPAGPLSFTYRRPVKFSVTGAAWQCDLTNHTFCINTEPYISSLAKVTSSSKASMPFLFYFDPNGRFSKADKKPMPRDNKVVTVEGCITDVTWGGNPDSPIQRFHVEVISIAFVGDAGKGSDGAVLCNTLDPSTPTPARGAGKFPPKPKRAAVASTSLPFAPAIPAAPPAPAAGFHPSVQLPHASPSALPADGVFTPGFEANVPQWMKAIPPSMLQQIAVTQSLSQPQSLPALQFTTTPPYHNVSQSPSLPATPQLLQPPPVDGTPMFDNAVFSQSPSPVFSNSSQSSASPLHNLPQNRSLGGQVLFSGTPQPQSMLNMAARISATPQHSPSFQTPSVAFSSPPAGPQVPTPAQRPLSDHGTACQPPAFSAQSQRPDAVGLVSEVPPAPSPSGAASRSESNPGTPHIPSTQPSPRSVSLTVSPQQLLQLTADRQLQSSQGGGVPPANPGSGPTTRKRGLNGHVGDEGRGNKQLKVAVKG